MRSESEMFDLILGIARQDQRIRAVYLNGSRTNPNATKDIFQDYDIVYVVTETKPFYEEASWINCFGERLIMQMPEHMDRLRGRECHWEDTYGWLMIFKDGNRLDLHVSSIEYARSAILEDKLCRILLDKDNILPPIPEATEEGYYVTQPPENDFICDCNDFWWCLNNVAKGLWRKEVPYVMDMLNHMIRPYLVHMLSWKIGIENNFACSIGKSGKYLNRYLTKETYERFLDTYPDGRVEYIWASVFEMCDLFDETAREVSDKLAFKYNQEEARAARYYLEQVYRMPEDAKF